MERQSRYNHFTRIIFLMMVVAFVPNIGSSQGTVVKDFGRVLIERGYKIVVINGGGSLLNNIPYHLIELNRGFQQVWKQQVSHQPIKMGIPKSLPIVNIKNDFSYKFGDPINLHWTHPSPAESFKYSPFTSASYGLFKVDTMYLNNRNIGYPEIRGFIMSENELDIKKVPVKSLIKSLKLNVELLRNLETTTIEQKNVLSTILLYLTSIENNSMRISNDFLRNLSNLVSQAKILFGNVGNILASSLEEIIKCLHIKNQTIIHKFD